MDYQTRKLSEALQCGGITEETDCVPEGIAP